MLFTILAVVAVICAWGYLFVPNSSFGKFLIKVSIVCAGAIALVCSL